MAYINLELSLGCVPNVVYYKLIDIHTLYTVLLKGNVANEQLSLLVSRSNSHATRETKRIELKPL